MKLLQKLKRVFTGAGSHTTDKAYNVHPLDFTPLLCILNDSNAGRVKEVHEYNTDLNVLYKSVQHKVIMDDEEEKTFYEFAAAAENPTYLIDVIRNVLLREVEPIISKFYDEYKGCVIRYYPHTSEYCANSRPTGWCLICNNGNFTLSCNYKTSKEVCDD